MKQSVLSQGQQENLSWLDFELLPYTGYSVKRRDSTDVANGNLSMAEALVSTEETSKFEENRKTLGTELMKTQSG